MNTIDRLFMALFLLSASIACWQYILKGKNYYVEKISKLKEHVFLNVISITLFGSSIWFAASISDHFFPVLKTIALPIYFIFGIILFVLFSRSDLIKLAKNYERWFTVAIICGVAFSNFSLLIIILLTYSGVYTSFSGEGIDSFVSNITAVIAILIALFSLFKSKSPGND